MKHRILASALCAAVLLCAPSLVAHHGMAGTYDMNTVSTLKATLTKVDWENPHIFVGVEAKRDDGKVENWKLESSGPLWFANNGVTKADFVAAIGQPVTIEFLKALDGSRTGYFEIVNFANGKSAYSMNGIKRKK